MDCNVTYFRSFVENFHEEKLKGDHKQKEKILFDYDDPKKKDQEKQQKINETKKIMRMNRANKNLVGEMSDDDKNDIFQDKENDLRNCLDIDQVEDKNDEIDVIQNKQKKLIKMNHSKVAAKFIGYDFVMKNEKILNLYRNDMGEVIQMLTHLGLMNSWTVKIVKKSEE